IIVYTSFSQDAAGEKFIDASQALPMVVRAANAPVFAIYPGGLALVMYDDGLSRSVGRYLTSYAAQGRIAVGIALRILEGERPQDIPIERGIHTYTFDWRALRQWRFKEANLPPGSIVVNREPNLWEAHRPYIMGGISLTLAQTLLIVGLLWQRKKRKKVEKSLVERLTFESLISDLSTTFIHLPEKEVNLHLEKSLERIGKFLGVQRITLREFSRDGKELKTQLSWNSEVSQPSHPDIHTERCRWSADRLRRGQALLISEVSDLPEEAGPEKEYLHNQKVLSAATIPLEVGGHVIGTLSFSSTNTRVSWTEDLVKQLRVVAEIFSNALERKSATEALHASVRELRAAEGILREGEERFRLVANRAPVLIWMAGPDRLCTYFNDPWLDFTGRPMEKELGDGWMEDVHPEDLPLCFHIYTQAFERREEYRMEYRLRRHDGEYRWVEDRGVPRFAPDGCFSGYIGSCVDITERKAASEALSSVSGRLIEAQELERTRIARELHDDINQRLALLAMDLEQLKSTRLRSAELRERATQLFNRTSEISADIQGLSHRLHSSKLEYLGIAPAMKGFCAELAEQQEVQITFTHGDVPGTLNNEVSLCLFRILQEGLINAVKHSGAQHFEAQLSCAQGTIRLTIRDQGVGFDPGTAMNSRGLGLISMRERVSLVKGTISIASKPMEGTEIMVSIPVEVGMEDSQAEFSVVTGAMGRPKVLLADDQPEILETVERLLEGQCEIVAKVDNGESMLDAVSRLDPDLVVLDISMPVLNGIEAAWRLKESGSRAKVIFLTVAEDPGFVEAAFSAGALGYVSKPHLASDVVPAVREVLQGHVFASQFSEAGEGGVP
ncbi:MAG TPA: response regulator, partial [Terriglobales bacterium]|nr:response regulator [Terriglobales bacterium]